LARCAPAQLAAPRLQEILMPGLVFRHKSFIGRFSFHCRKLNIVIVQIPPLGQFGQLQKRLPCRMGMVADKGKLSKPPPDSHFQRLTQFFQIFFQWSAQPLQNGVVYLFKFQVYSVAHKLSNIRCKPPAVAFQVCRNNIIYKMIGRIAR
jgi:hypothetical protein